VPGYTLPDGETLKNRLNAVTSSDLARLEAPLVAAAEVELLMGGGPTGQLDEGYLRALHRHLFTDVYEWAGRTRDELVLLSDGSIATEPLMKRKGQMSFLPGPLIPNALDALFDQLENNGFLCNLSRVAFAEQAADFMLQLNAIHPFREGNGRTQRAFLRELSRRAGYRLEFDVISRERMIVASIEGNENNNPGPMRRMFVEITDPIRVAALRQAQQFLESQEFDWNDRYMATTEPGQQYDAIFVSAAGSSFMFRDTERILIGWTRDLPTPTPRGHDHLTFLAGLPPLPSPEPNAKYRGKIVVQTSTTITQETNSGQIEHELEALTGRLDLLQIGREVQIAYADGVGKVSAVRRRF
jgi:cell filamentation protein